MSFSSVKPATRKPRRFPSKPRSPAIWFSPRCTRTMRPSSFTRLQEMGIEPFLMANSTIGIIAQRLARRICQNCKKQVEVDDTTLGYFGYTRENAPPFFKGEGCDKCSGTGYKGRVGIYELLSMNDDLKRAVASGAKTDDIPDLAVKNGMKTLKQYAMILMAEGLTTVEEVLTNLVVEG